MVIYNELEKLITQGLYDFRHNDNKSIIIFKPETRVGIISEVDEFRIEDNNKLTVLFKNEIFNGKDGEKPKQESITKEEFEKIMMLHEINGSMTDIVKKLVMNIFDNNIETGKITDKSDDSYHIDVDKLKIEKRIIGYKYNYSLNIKKIIYDTTTKQLHIHFYKPSYEDDTLVKEVIMLNIIEDIDIYIKFLQTIKKYKDNQYE